MRQLHRRPIKPSGWLGPTAPVSSRKQIFLPNFTIALIRTPFLPPRYASFYVPLKFNKLDMRDYLYRVYGVKVLSIRSYVRQFKARRSSLGGRWRRPQSKKKMTVEMQEPFVWPEPPEDMTPWDNEHHTKSEEYQKNAKSEATGRRSKHVLEADEDDRGAFEKQAKELLEGKQVWRPTWQALGIKYDRPTVPRFEKGSGS